MLIDRCFGCCEALSFFGWREIVQDGECDGEEPGLRVA